MLKFQIRVIPLPCHLLYLLPIFYVLISYYKLFISLFSVDDVICHDFKYICQLSIPLYYWTNLQKAMIIVKQSR